jgi:hypothetical protein
VSDDISEPGKISKNYSELFEAYRETTFDYSNLEVSRLREKDMPDDT